jgi:hypothetical protein
MVKQVKSASLAFKEVLDQQEIQGHQDQWAIKALVVNQVQMDQPGPKAQVVLQVNQGLRAKPENRVQGVTMGKPGLLEFRAPLEILALRVSLVPQDFRVLKGPMASQVRQGNPDRWELLDKVVTPVLPESKAHGAPKVKLDKSALLDRRGRMDLLDQMVLQALEDKLVLLVYKENQGLLGLLEW